MRCVDFSIKAVKIWRVDTSVSAQSVGNGHWQWSLVWTRSPFRDFS